MQSTWEVGRFFVWNGTINKVFDIKEKIYRYISMYLCIHINVARTLIQPLKT